MAFITHLEAEILEKDFSGRCSYLSFAITELLTFNLQIFMESRDPDHALIYPLLAIRGWRPRKDVVWTMNHYNRSTVDVR